MARGNILRLWVPSTVRFPARQILVRPSPLRLSVSRQIHSRSGVRLLKCLCQTEEEKAVGWHSDARSLERQGIPRVFTAKSRVIIISND
jgi:hypothetical protein